MDEKGMAVKQTPETIIAKLRELFEEVSICNDISHGIKVKLYGTNPTCQAEEENGREPCIENAINDTYTIVMETKHNLQEIDKKL